MDKFGEHLDEIEIKHLKFEKELDQVSSQVSTILKFTCQWEDLQNELKQAKECLSVLASELTLQQKTLEDKEKTLKQWREELETRSIRVDRKLNEIEAREREKDFLERRIGECRSEVKSLEKVARGLRNKEDEMKSSISSHNCELGRKEEELNTINNLLKGRNSWLELKEKKLKALQDLVETCSDQVDNKSKELRGVEISLNLCLENLESAKKKSDEAENFTKQLLEELNLKEEKLQAVKELIVKNSEELNLKEEKLQAVKELIQKNSEELNLKEEKLQAVKELIEKNSEELNLKEEKLQAVKELIEKNSEELNLKEEKLQAVKELIEKNSEELNLKEEKLQAVKKQIEKNSEELASKLNYLDKMNESIQENICRLQEQEKRYNSAEEAISTLSTKRIMEEIELSTVQCSIEEIFRDHRLKVDHLDSIMVQIQGKTEQLQVMENRCVEMQISLDLLSTMTRTSVEQHEEELGKRKLKLEQVQKSVHECSEELTKLMEQDVSTRKSFERLCNEVEAKEKELNNMKNLLKEYREKAECEEGAIKTAERKSKQLEEREKHCDSLDGTLKRRSEELHVKEMGLDQRLKEFESKGKQKIDVHKSIQEIYKEVESGLRRSSHLDEGKREASEPLDLCQDLAEVVLAFLKRQGFRANNRSNRILVLERLVEVSPLVNPELKKASSSLADDWRNFCQGTKHPGEVLALLLFMIAFGLVSNSNCNPILRLIDNVSKHNQAPAICQSLGFTHQIPGFIKTLIRRKKHLKVVATSISVDDLLPELAWQKYLSEARETCILASGEDSKEAQDGVVVMRGVLTFMAEYVREISSVPEDLTAHVQVAKRKTETSLNPVPVIEPHSKSHSKSLKTRSGTC